MARKDEAYLYLKNAIISNQLMPDQPISELAVAAELKMSRSPIREALRELEAEGMVVSYPSRGAFVASLSPQDVEEIYALRVLLETWALERSINRIPEETLEEIEGLFRQSAESGDWEKRHLADRELHETIVEYAGSKRLMEFIDVLNSQTERIRRASAADKKRIEASYEEHMEILRCLKARDKEAAHKALTLHLRAVADSAMEATRFRLR